jgi:hypothetical protein
MLTNSNLPASELENIGVAKNFKLLMPSSVRRSMMLNPPNSGGPCRIAVGVVFDAPSFCNATAIIDVWTFASPPRPLQQLGERRA